MIDVICIGILLLHIILIKLQTCGCKSSLVVSALLMYCALVRLMRAQEDLVTTLDSTKIYLVHLVRI